MFWGLEVLARYFFGGFWCCLDGFRDHNGILEAFQLPRNCSYSYYAWTDQDRCLNLISMESRFHWDLGSYIGILEAF